METLTIALWAANLEPPLNGVDGWAAGVEAKMKEAKAEGAIPGHTRVSLPAMAFLRPGRHQTA
jgi:hypothetical protein